MSIGKYRSVYFFFICFILFVNLFHDSANSEEINESSTKILLTDAEKAWLSEHPKIRVNGDEWPPFVIKGGNGEYSGISIDILKKAASFVNLEIEIIPGEWDQMFKMLKNNELDLAHDIIKTPKREEILHFTEPYIATPNAIYVKQDNSQIKSINDLKGKTVPVVKDYYLEEILADQYPEIKQLSVSSPLEGLKKVVSGEADAYLGALIVSQYILQKNLIGGLKIAGYFEEVPLSPSFAVRNDYQTLANIMQKALASINEIEKAHIIEEYISLTGVPPVKNVIQLTEEEKAWLADHPKVQIGIMNDWAPMNFVDESGIPNGIGVDYINLLNKRLDGVLDIVPAAFEENYELVKNKKLDALMDITPKEEREAFFEFTSPYLSIPHVYVGRKDGPYVRSAEDLFGRTIALEKGYYNITLFRDSYPQVKVKEYSSTSKALEAVSRGEADAYAGNRAVAIYLMAKGIMGNLQVQGSMNKPPVELSIGVRKDWPILADILESALEDITEEEKYEIGKKWVLSESDRNELTNLTQEEKDWLIKHPVIRVHNEMDWPPFNYFEHGNPKGLSIDYMNLLAEKLGIKVEYVTGPSWNDFLEMIRNKDLDVMLNIVKTEERQKYLLFTDPYFMNPNVIICSQQQPFDRLEELYGKTVAFPKGFFWEEVLSESFPQIKRLPVDDSLSSLKAVALGKADAALGELAVVQYLINENMLTGLSFSNEVDIGDPELVQLRVGIRNDWPLLQSAIIKAMADVTPQEMNQFRQKWLMTDEDEAHVTKSEDKGISVEQLIIYGVVILIIISLLGWILLKAVKNEKIAFSFGSSWFRGLVLAGLSIFVVIVIMAGWFTLESYRGKSIESMSNFLTGVLELSTERIQFWMEERRSFIKRLGRDPELVAITKRLLKVTPDQKTLLESEALKDAQEFFANTDNTSENIDFFIINPGHISIASMRDTNIGTQNLISMQYPDILKKAFQGQVDFVPPMTSDVQLDNAASKTEKKSSTMFFIAPVQDSDGQILAVMALRVNPWNDLGRVLNTSTILSSGETYAFDDKGILLSNSRFDEQLRQMDLITEGQNSALNIEIRNPGVNMTEGHKPELERSQQPLTSMASRALELKEYMEKEEDNSDHSDIETDMEGYRDYRGVPVFGAWLWYTDMGFGLATEIDVDEALSDYYIMRRTIFILLGFTLLLSVSAILLVLVLGERSSKALMKARDNLEQKVEERTAELKEQHDKLEEAEERSSLLLHSAGEGIFGVDINGCLNFINPSALDMLGFKEAELIGEKVHTFIHHSFEDGSSYPIEDCPMHKSFTEGTSHHVEDEVLWKKDGISFPVEYSSTPMEKEGKVIGAVITFRDITERKAAEERFSALLESAPDAMIVSDKAGKIILVNSQAEIIFGYTREELIGQKIDMLVPEEIRDRHPDNRAKYYADPQRISRGDFLGIAKDGAEIPIDIGLSPIETEDGLIVVASIRDITERKIMEDAIASERKRLQGILDTSPIGVSISIKGEIQFANPRFIEMFGIDLGEKIPKLYVNLKDREDLLKRLENEGKVEDFELQMYNSNNQVMEILSNYLPVTYENEEGILAWMIDITERKTAEEAIRESEERIKTILNSINTGIIVIEEESRVIVDTNPVAEKIIGLPRERIIGNSCHKFICPREKHDCPIIDHGQIVDNSDRTLLNSEGQEIPILKTVVRVILNGKSHLVESFVDLTERKKAEKELKQHLDELERFNRLTIDREEKMINLKKEINELLSEIGKSSKYKIVQ